MKKRRKGIFDSSRWWMKIEKYFTGCLFYVGAGILFLILILISVIFNTGSDYYKLAEKNYLNDQYAQSLENLDLAINHWWFPTNEEKVYYLKANVYFEMNEFSKASVAITKTIKENPDYYAYYLIRAECDVELGNYDNALKDCNKAISIDNELAWAYSLRAYVYKQKKDFQKAIQDYNSAINLEDWNYFYYYMRANSKVETKDLYGSVTDYTLALEKISYFNFVESSDICATDSVLFELKLVNKLCIITSDLSKIYKDRARAKIILGDYKNAIPDLNRFASLTPQKPSIFYLNKKSSVYNNNHRDCY